MASLLLYWIHVEIGRSGDSGSSAPQEEEDHNYYGDTSIATKLHWTRTTLGIKPSSICQDGSKITGLPPSFQREAQFPPSPKLGIIQDAAILYLTNLHSLDTSAINQETITDGSFRHLTNLECLDMSF